MALPVSDDPTREEDVERLTIRKEEEGEDDEDEETEGELATEKRKLENLLHRLSSESVSLRVHDVVIKGNTSNKESLIQAEVEALRNAASMQELLQASRIANARLQRLGIFDSVDITLDSGPLELPGTANVIIKVTEARNPLTGEIGIFTKPQELDLRYASPLGFLNAAFNFGISAGAIFPWGNELLSMPSSLPDRFFLGGNSSPICTLGGLTALLGFECRGLGPSEPRREIVDKTKGENPNSSGRDAVGGDFAVTAFADLSFDLPLKLLRESGIHGHAFACAGNLLKLTEGEFRILSFPKFWESVRSCTGVGVVIPTNLFHIEVNYCYILKQLGYDHGKTGVQFSFSSPL